MPEMTDERLAELAAEAVLPGPSWDTPTERRLAADIGELVAEVRRLRTTSYEQMRASLETTLAGHTALAAEVRRLRAALAGERERCAAVADAELAAWLGYSRGEGARSIAAAIRALKE